MDDKGKGKGIGEGKGKGKGNANPPSPTPEDAMDDELALTTAEPGAGKGKGEGKGRGKGKPPPPKPKPKAKAVETVVERVTHTVESPDRTFAKIQILWSLAQACHGLEVEFEDANGKKKTGQWEDVLELNGCGWAFPVKVTLVLTKAKPTFVKRSKTPEHLSEMRLPSLPPAPIDEPRWETAFTAQASESGADGVLFVATASGVLVVKAGKSPAQEYFAARVLRCLRVPAPEVRAVHWPHPELFVMRESMSQARHMMKRRSHLSEATKVGYRMGKTHAHLLVFGLVKNSKPFECYDLAKDLLEVEGVGDRVAAVERLQALGRCVAADVFLNNGDRCPAPCWDNEGNAGNIMMPADLITAGKAAAKVGAGFVAIDNMVTCINTSTEMGLKNCELYMSRARAFLEDCARGENVDKMFENIRVFIHANTGVSLSDASLAEIRTGVQQVIAAIADPGQEDADRIEERSFPDFIKALLEDVKSQGHGSGIWEDNAACIDGYFLQQMCAVFTEVANKHTIPLPLPPSLERGISLASTNSRGMPVIPPIVDADDPETFGFSKKLWEQLPEELRKEFVEPDANSGVPLGLKPAVCYDDVHIPDDF